MGEKEKLIEAFSLLLLEVVRKEIEKKGNKKALLLAVAEQR